MSYMKAKATQPETPKSLRELAAVPNAKEFGERLRDVAEEIGASDPHFSYVCESLGNWLVDGRWHPLGAAVD